MEVTRLGCAVLVGDRHLALGVGAELGLVAGVARGGHQPEDAMRVLDRRRHQLRRLAAGVAEHDALVAGALVLVAGGIDALRDIQRLRVQEHLDLRRLPVEAMLLVADVLHRLARHLLHEAHVDAVGPARLAGDHDAVRRGQRLARDADLVGVEA